MAGEVYPGPGGDGIELAGRRRGQVCIAGGEGIIASGEDASACVQAWQKDGSGLRTEGNRRADIGGRQVQRGQQ